MYIFMFRDTLSSLFFLLNIANGCHMYVTGRWHGRSCGETGMQVCQRARFGEWSHCELFIQLFCCYVLSMFLSESMVDMSGSFHLIAGAQQCY